MGDTGNGDMGNIMGSMTEPRRLGTFARAAICLLPLCLASLPAPALAQNVQELVNRVDRLQRELNTLQRQVYTGKTPPAAAEPAPGASADTGAASDPRTAARNSIRITQLENEIRRLTGRNEEIEHRLGEIQARLEKLVTDVDQRLNALEGGARPPSATTGALSMPPQGAEPPAGAPGESPAALPQPPGPPAAAPGGLGAPPRNLGTIPKDLAVETPRGPDPAATAAAEPVLPAGTPQQQYDYALSLMLQKQDFAKAETSLRAFVEAHPKDPLAGNAQYWLGETHFVRKNYQDAAFAFADAFQKYPKGNKAPDSLLKLGMSLAELDKRKEACTAYSRLLETFPKVGQQLRGRVEREQRRSKCK